jgi:hypothetical protein
MTPPLPPAKQSSSLAARQQRRLALRFRGCRLGMPVPSEMWGAAALAARMAQPSVQPHHLQRAASAVIAQVRHDPPACKPRVVLGVMATLVSWQPGFCTENQTRSWCACYSPCKCGAFPARKARCMLPPALSSSVQAFSSASAVPPSGHVSEDHPKALAEALEWRPKLSTAEEAASLLGPAAICTGATQHATNHHATMPQTTRLIVCASLYSPCACDECCATDHAIASSLCKSLHRHIQRPRRSKRAFVMLNCPAPLPSRRLRRHRARHTAARVRCWHGPLVRATNTVHAHAALGAAIPGRLPRPCAALHILNGTCLLKSHCILVLSATPPLETLRHE